VGTSDGVSDGAFEGGSEEYDGVSVGFLVGV